MGIIEIILTGIGLAMDAGAASICKGLSMKKFNIKNIIIVGIYFGIFQGIMPIIGYLLGINFKEAVIKVDHFIAFGLLSIIGINMIREAFDNDENITENIGFKEMIFLSIATSIDALAVGITFAFLDVNIILSSIIIMLVTFVISVLGGMIGAKFGDRFKNKAQIFRRNSIDSNGNKDFNRAFNFLI